MASAPSFAIRDFEARDLASAHALTRTLGWSHREVDWRFLWESDTSAGLIAERDGQVIGAALYQRYGSEQGAVGLVVVHPAQQRQGIGRKLMDACLARLDGRAVYLIATDEGRPLYEHLGFSTVGLVTVYAGNASGAADLAAVPAATVDGLRMATTEDHERMIDALQSGEGLQRRPLLESVLRVGEAALVEAGGKVLGVSVFRPWAAGYLIGPLVADNQRTAQALTEFWLRKYPGRLIRVDWTQGTGPDEWLAPFGLSNRGTSPLMRRGHVATEPSELKRYVVLSQATC